MAMPALKKRRLSPLNDHDVDDSDFVSPEGSVNDHEQQRSNKRVGHSETKAKSEISSRTNRNVQSTVNIPSSHGGYGSSILKLQVDELLGKLRKDNEKKAVEIDHVLRKLKAIIERIPGHEATTVSHSLTSW